MSNPEKNNSGEVACCACAELEMDIRETSRQLELMAGRVRRWESAASLAGDTLEELDCSAWISCEKRPPTGEDFGCFADSVDVLMTDGKDQWVGYLQTWEDEEYDPTWKMKGPDGWDVKNVTHWMPLPSLPNVKLTDGGQETQPEKLERENLALRKDKERLDWLRHHVAGKEFRRIGICMDNSSDLDELRQRIDDIISANDKIMP